MKKVALLLGVWVALSNCNAVTRGSRLSDSPLTGRQFFLSTGSVQQKYKTIGFLQIRGYGIELAGVTDLGDAQLDGTIKKTMVGEATKMGGNGVINIEFLDENPSTDFEKAQNAAQSINNVLSGGGVTQKDRYVTVTGEVIKFLE